MIWTKEQQNIIDSRDCDLLVSAAAGSGKTAVLVERIVKLVTDGDSPVNIDQLLVVTFTNAAAAQMREKINNALIKCQEENPTDEHIAKQVNLVHNADIMTIDSFCLKVVKENFNIAGVDANFRIGDGIELDLMKADVMSEFLESKYSDGDSAFIELVNSLVTDRSDDKIESLIYRINSIASSYPVIEDWFQNAISAIDINNIDDLMDSRWMKLAFEKHMTTLKSAFLLMLKAKNICIEPGGCYNNEVVINSDISLLSNLKSITNYEQLRKSLNVKWSTIKSAKKDDIDVDKYEELKEIRKQYKELVNSVTKALKEPEAILEEIRLTKPNIQTVLRLSYEYYTLLQKRKSKKGVYDFSDIEHMALKVLSQGYETDEDGKKKIIPSQYGLELSETYLEIMIDEYQDSNYLQEDILNCVTRKPKTDNMFMVGDIKQSIYKFRMARPELFIDKYDRYESDCGTKRKIILNRNFRSRPVVLDAINYVFSQIMSREMGGVDYDTDSALVPGLEYAKTDKRISTSTELIILDRSDAEDADTEFGTYVVSSEKNKHEMEAFLIAKRIKELMDRDNPTYVWDDDIKDYRPVMYKDIVILLRSVSGVVDFYLQSLKEMSIPCYSESSTGYFDTIEVTTILNFLTVIDNAYCDVDIVGLLKSPIFKFTEEEISKFVIKSRKEGNKDRKFIYDSILFYIQYGDDPELADKLIKFNDLLMSYRRRKEYMTVYEVINSIYYETDYLMYVLAMPGGEVRKANLMKLLDKAKTFEHTSYRGLFNFLRYIKRLKTFDADMSEASLLGDDENVVRIMSIHKSKGLEFPVVILADTGKLFNKMDTKQEILIHPDMYLATKYTNLIEHYKKDTFIHRSFIDIMDSENEAEEMRVLYVALTRAKEKLIITGSVKDIGKHIYKWKYLASHKSTKLDVTDVKMASSYLDWLTEGLIRYKGFEKAILSLPARKNKDGDILGLGYNIDSYIGDDSVRVDVSIVTTIELSNYVYKYYQDIMKEECRLEDIDINTVDDDLYSKLIKNFEWKYKYDQFTKQIGKLSVSQIKTLESPDRNKVDSRLVSDINNQDYDSSYNKALMGTYIHKLLETLDFTRTIDEVYVRACIQELCDNNKIDADYIDKIPVDKVISLAQSEFGNMISNALQSNTLYREKQFVVGFPIHKVLKDIHSDETILVQGMVDGYIVDDDGIILFDYKSDRVNVPEELLERYITQIKYYGYALSQIIGKPIKRAIIYSIALGKCIDCPIELLS